MALAVAVAAVARPVRRAPAAHVGRSRHHQNNRRSHTQLEDMLGPRAEHEAPSRTSAARVECTTPMFDRAIAFFGLVAIAVREPLRDRLAYFWSLAQPLFAISFVALSSGHVTLDVPAIARYGLYVCFVNSVYSTGAMLIWKRESGLLRGFARTRAQRRRLILIHIIASAIYSLIFCGALLLLLSFINEVSLPIASSLSVLIAGIFASVISSVGSLVFLRTALSSGNCAALLNVYSFALAMLTFFVGPSTQHFVLLQSFNPVTLMAALFYMPLAPDQMAGVAMMCAIWLVVFLLAGAAGIAGFRLRPSNSR
jgi:hypothetical protein